MVTEYVRLNKYVAKYNEQTNNCVCCTYAGMQVQLMYLNVDYIEHFQDLRYRYIFKIDSIKKGNINGLINI